MICKLGDPMSLHHPVPIVWQPTTAPQQVQQFVNTTRVVVLEAHNKKKDSKH